MPRQPPIQPLSVGATMLLTKTDGWNTSARVEREVS